MKRFVSVAVLALLALAVATGGIACDKSEKPAGAAGAPGGAMAKGARPFPVEVQIVAAKDVQYTISAVGTVEAFEEVQVTARVAGVVEKVGFVEGELVKQGQALVEIEPARYQLAVRAARAALEKTEAAVSDAEAGLARRESAAKDNPGLIPGEEIETWRTKVRSTRAEVSSARVAVDQAQLNLRDAYVRAPIAGLLQTRSVKTGQYVQAGTVLGTLVRREPLLLRFDVPAREAARLSVGMTVTFASGNENEREDQPYTARVTLVAASADATSRMVPVTAEIDDPRKATLRPGAFARVTAGIGGNDTATVIPQMAVRPSERGFLAFTVVDGKAKEHVLELGMRTADGMVEVRSGVEPGEQLVVRGAEALREGAPVSIPAAKPSAGGAPPGAAAPAGGIPTKVAP